MLIVIADDITGAAEIAGIAKSYGCDVNFVMWTDNNVLTSTQAEITVIATDMRSLSEQEAVRISRDIVGCFSNLTGVRFFKKTDSALRGHISAELQAMLSETKLDKVLLLPQNPSKKRVISSGQYLINKVPIEQTAFASDPEFPATTSFVTDVVAGSCYVSVDDSLNVGINICEAESEDDVRKQLDKADDNVLLAGAADLFNAILNRYFIKKECVNEQTNINGVGKKLVLCGSTLSRSLIGNAYFANRASAEENMPLDVFHGAAAYDWTESLRKTYTGNECLIVRVGHQSTGGADYANRIKNVFACLANTIVCEQQPSLIVIEGGATAFAVIGRLGWTSFSVKRELSPGVVCLSYGDTDIILKPGSYDWGNLFR